MAQVVTGRGNPGHWRISQDQPILIGGIKHATPASNGYVDKGTVSDARHTSLRTHRLRAERKRELAKAEAKRNRNRRARARRRTG